MSNNPPTHLLVEIQKTDVYSVSVNPLLERHPISPSTMELIFPHGGREEIFTSTEGIADHFSTARSQLISSAGEVLDGLATRTGGFSKRYAFLSGVIDTTLSSIDAAIALVQTHNWDAIHNVTRACLDGYLLYDGVSYAVDDASYEKGVFGDGKKPSNHKSVADDQLTYTHIAELSSYKSSLMHKLFKTLSAKHHFGVEAINRMSWNSGQDIDRANSVLRLAIGGGIRPLDAQGLESCIAFMYLLDYSSLLGTPLTSEQVAEAKNAVAQRRQSNNISQPKSP